MRHEYRWILREGDTHPAGSIQQILGLNALLGRQAFGINEVRSILGLHKNHLLYIGIRRRCNVVRYQHITGDEQERIHSLWLQNARELVMADTPFTRL